MCDSSRKYTFNKVRGYCISKDVWYSIAFIKRNHIDEELTGCWLAVDLRTDLISGSFLSMNVCDELRRT